MTAFTKALAALKAGLSLVPPRRDGTKAPLGEWKQYQNEPPTLAQVEQWYVHEGHAGLGLVCGAVSNGLEMLEIEGSARAEGMHNQFLDRCKQADLGEVFERIVLGYSETTPTGGFHFLYRCNEIEGNQKLARRPIDGVVQVLIETRGEGGYVVVAPTPGEYHPSGKPWEMKHGGFGSIVTITPDEREALLDVARSFDEMPKREISEGGSSNDSAVRRREPVGQSDSLAGPHPPRSPEEDRPGDWFNETQSWHEILEPHGWAPLFRTSDEVMHWRRPGKDIGTSATTNHAGSDLFWVFSTSTVFDSETSYTKFGAWCLLEHGGDFVAAARAARALMGGAPPNYVDPSDLLAGFGEAAVEVEPLAGSWAPQDLGPVLDGTPPPSPDILAVMG